MPYALVCVKDTRGLEKLKALTNKGWVIVACDNSIPQLENHEIPYTALSSLTGVMYMMDPRLENMHPTLAGGILFDRESEESRQKAVANGMPWFDLALVNLSLFSDQQSFSQMSLGNATVLMSGISNGGQVPTISNPDDYTSIISEIMETRGISRESQERLAMESAKYLAKYFMNMTRWMEGREAAALPIFHCTKKVQ